jgi:CubicO group peptidase (beta-lactamase class C family)
MNRRLLAPLSILFIIIACNNSEQKNETGSGSIVTDAVKAHIDSTLKTFIDSNKTVAVSALIFEKGKEVYYNAFGYADREAKKPMDRNSIVRIFSMTKPITGVALMTLYEKGKFQLDDPLSKYAPEFANMKVFKGVDAKGNFILQPVSRPITIRDITRHTAGWAAPDTSALGKMVKSVDAGNRTNSLSEMAKKLASLPLQFDPGTQWAYGPSVDVQAYLVEKLSGKPYDQYVKETVLDPLQMTNTRYVIPESDLLRFAAIYTRNDTTGGLTRQSDEQANSFNTKKWPLTPGGWGLTSTLDDYMKFAQMLVHKGALNGVRILKPETIELMSTNQLSDTISKRMWLPSKGQVGFGIDFAVRTAPPKTKEENNGTVGEFFWDGAASTLFWVDPKNDLTAVLFTQLQPFDKIKLHKRFRDAIYGAYEPGPVSK